MKLIVGLGNPGKEYEQTRHNCGFRVLDALADLLSLDFNKEDFHGVYTRFKLDDEDIILFKPYTFMNLSGTAVQEISHFFKIDKENILIVYDDMALKPGLIRLRLNGSSGGQKGMQNIIDNLSTQDIKRIRVGIGEPEHSGIDFVLGKPHGEDKDKIDAGIIKARDAIRDYLNRDFHYSMSKYNGGDNT